MRHVSFLVLLLLVPGVTGSQSLKSLGGAPVCEASAATVVACPSGDGFCLALADNEVGDRLFLYQLGKRGKPGVASRQALPIGKLLKHFANKPGQLTDIEALASVPPDKLLVYGSHSRNKACEGRADRRRYLHATLSRSRFREGNFPAVQSPGISCEHLFSSQLLRSDRLVEEICATITNAEQAAEAARKADDRGARRAACDLANAFNIEGVVAIPSGQGEEHRIWLGLRAPLHDQKAILLRQHRDLSSLRIDAVALLDLGGLGIREVTLSKGSVWIIGGPSGDQREREFRLLQMRADEIKPGKISKPERVRNLPDGAEGLAIHGHTAIVLMDGARGPNGGDCARDATYTLVELPR